MSSASHTAVRMPDVWTIFPFFFFYVIRYVAYLLAVKGRYVHETSASIFSGECGPFNCRSWAVKAILNKGDLIYVWTSSRSVGVKLIIPKEYVKTETA
jgi:hypothetical protein